jgi:hypothetical protein
MTMRDPDPAFGPPQIDQFIRDYDTYFWDLIRYENHLMRLTAGYTRGDSVEELRDTFAYTVGKVLATDQSIREKDGPDVHIFSHRGLYSEKFRDAIVLLSFGLCLRAPRNDIAAILGCCDRGDPLMETLARTAAPGLERPQTAPAFPVVFDGLYAALEASETERERCLREYLAVWYSVKMKGFSFKDTDKIHDRAVYVGYWCFEAAGVVAALRIDDRRFRDHPQYPKDLVRFYLGD